MTASMQRAEEQTLEADEEDFGPQSISKLEVQRHFTTNFPEKLEINILIQ
jgi:hypothetical protein